MFIVKIRNASFGKLSFEARDEDEMILAKYRLAPFSLMIFDSRFS